VSEYSSNFRRWSPYLRVCRLTCDFTARWFASFAAADQPLTEQRRNNSSWLAVVAEPGRDPTDQPVYVQNGQVPANTYPRWEYFPRNVRPPEWVEPFVAEVRAIETRISTIDQGTGLHSNDVLRELAPGLKNLGYAVESSRSEVNRIRRPVLYGSNWRAEVAYDIDAFHDDHGIVVEVEAAPEACRAGASAEARPCRPESAARAARRGRLEPVQEVFTDADRHRSTPIDDTVRLRLMCDTVASLDVRRFKLRALSVETTTASTPSRVLSGGGACSRRIAAVPPKASNRSLMPDSNSGTHALGAPGKSTVTAWSMTNAGVPDKVVKWCPIGIHSPIACLLGDCCRTRRIAPEPVPLPARGRGSAPGSAFAG
jgi:hypothetical protein